MSARRASGRANVQFHAADHKDDSAGAWKRTRVINMHVNILLVAIYYDFHQIPGTTKAFVDADEVNPRSKISQLEPRRLPGKSRGIE